MLSDTTSYSGASVDMYEFVFTAHPAVKANTKNNTGDAFNFLLSLIFVCVSVTIISFCWIEGFPLRSRFKVLLGCVAAMVLTACVTPVTIVQPVDPAIRDSLAVERTEVVVDDDLADYKLLDQPKLVSALEDEFSKSLPIITDENSQTPVEVHVEVLAYREPNAALAIVLGDTAQIVGNVVLKEPETALVIGEYYIEVIEGAGGLLGLAAADTNEPELAREFVEKFMEFLVKDSK